MFRDFISTRIGYLRRIYHLHKLWLVLRRNQRPAGDTSEHNNAEGRRDDAPEEAGTVDDTFEIDPMLIRIPHHVSKCHWGHMLFFHTVPIFGYDNMAVLGCDGENCPQNYAFKISNSGPSSSQTSNPMA